MFNLYVMIMPDQPIKLLLFENASSQLIKQIFGEYILCVIIEVFFRPCQLIELFMIGILRQSSQVIILLDSSWYLAIVGILFRITLILMSVSDE